MWLERDMMCVKGMCLLAIGMNLIRVVQSVTTVATRVNIRDLIGSGSIEDGPGPVTVIRATDPIVFLPGETISVGGGRYLNLQAEEGTTVIFDGQGTGKFFDVGVAYLTLQGITLRNGSGPAIYSGGYLTLKNCIFEGHVSNSDGAAIYVGVDGYLTIEDCTFSGNTADRNGDDIYFRGDLTNFDVSGTTVESAYCVNGPQNECPITIVQLPCNNDADCLDPTFQCSCDDGGLQRRLLFGAGRLTCGFCVLKKRLF